MMTSKICFDFALVVENVLQVTRMFDESEGTLRLVRDDLGDERVPLLSLEKLKEIYQTGRGSVRSWRTTAGLANGGDKTGHVAALAHVIRASTFSPGDCFSPIYVHLRRSDRGHERSGQRAFMVIFLVGGFSSWGVGENQ